MPSKDPPTSGSLVSTYLTPEELTNIKEVFQIFTYEGSGAMRKDDLRVALRVLGLEVSHQQYLGYCALFTTSAGRAGGGGVEGMDVFGGGGSSSMLAGSHLDSGTLEGVSPPHPVGGGASSSESTSISGTPIARSSSVATKSVSKFGAAKGPAPNAFLLEDFIEICIDARDSRTEVVRGGDANLPNTNRRGLNSSQFDLSAAKESPGGGGGPMLLSSRGKTIREAFSYCDENREGSLTPKHLGRMLQDLSRSVALCSTGSTSSPSPSSSLNGGGGGGTLNGLEIPSEEELAALLADLGIDPKTGITEEDLISILSTSSSIL